MKAIASRSRRAAAAALIALIAFVTAGCGLADLSGAAVNHSPGPAVRLTEHVPAAALVIVADRTVTGTDLSRTVAATAQPNEYLDILRPGAQPGPVMAAESPVPATVVVAGKPIAPGHGASSYQSAQYGKQLSRWEGQVAAGTRMVRTQTAAATASWARGLRIPGAGTGQSGDLAGESASAASAIAGLDQAGSRFGSRCVLVLYVTSLSGPLPAGQLSGDDVMAITPILPSAAAVSAAQAKLLGAGAAHAAVLGPEATPAQIDHLISAGLSQNVITETLSGAALFANNSAVLLPGATHVLTPVLALLRHPGATGVINGYASSTGSASWNNTLSAARAAAVAGFFEGHGVSPSALLVVGHGASDLVAPGPSGTNRRVVVVVAESAGNGS